MPNRYDNIKTLINNSELYSNILENRGKKTIEQYSTYRFNPVTQEIKSRLNTTTHIWSYGDRFFNLSNRFYGDHRYWWIIAWYNEKPTEQHITNGETIFIPQPLTDALSYYYGG